MKRGSTIYSDQHPGYTGIKGYDHASVAHSVGEYVRGKIHTNGIESFWVLLKRGYVGTHHHMSFKHLHRYANEFAFRQNDGKDNSLHSIGKTIDGMIGCRLSYQELIA